jgi:hypothetical protein
MQYFRSLQGKRLDYSKHYSLVQVHVTEGQIISIREKLVLITLKGESSLKENYLCVNVTYRYTKIAFFVTDKYINTHG